jgi:hypothetical protein
MDLAMLCSIVMSSRDLRDVSGRRKVEKRPQNIKSANIFMMLSSHGEQAVVLLQSIEAPRLRSGSKARAVMAPSLPEAAEIPWAVARYRVGKSSPGMMKVVALGPSPVSQCALFLAE